MAQRVCGCHTSACRAVVCLRVMSRIHRVLALAALLASCSTPSSDAKGGALSGAAPAVAPSSAAPAAPATPSAAASVLEGAALVLDVRTAAEHAEGHLPEDTLIPVQELEGRVAEVEAAVKGDKAAKIVTYCRAGKRAEQAKQVLVAHGFTNVVNGGGYEALSH
jgi:phage shock protein E